MNKFILGISCVGLLVISGCTSLARTPTPKRSELPRFSIPYVSDGGHRQQKLDVYFPEGENTPFPTIFTIHGGGFTFGTKAMYNETASYFNERGYAVVSIDYRLAPDFNYPAQVEDAFCALAWVHANAATYGFDTERIIAFGDSAGAYLAAMLGTVDTPSIYMEGCPNPLPPTDWIHGVVGFYGGYDYTNIDAWTVGLVKRREVFWGSTFDELPAETLAEMSPMSWVDGSEPPFLLIHGVSDGTVPAQMSEDFASKLEASGATVELLMLSAAFHGFVGDLTSRAYKESLETVDTWLAVRFER